MTSSCGRQSAQIDFLSDRTAQGHPAIQQHPTILGSLWQDLEQQWDWGFCSLTQPECWIVLPAPIPTLTPPRGDLVCQEAKDPGLPSAQRTPSQTLLSHTRKAEQRGLVFLCREFSVSRHCVGYCVLSNTALSSLRQYHPVAQVKKSGLQEVKPSSQIHLANGKVEVQSHVCCTPETILPHSSTTSAPAKVQNSLVTVQTTN